MGILVDTNILLRSVQPHHPQYASVERAFAALRSKNESLQVTIQNLVEFWAVATRPAKSENGLGMTTEAATREMVVLVDLFPLLPEPISLFEEWRRLVTTYKVSGKSTHDAKLVAAMKVNGVSRSSHSMFTISRGTKISRRSTQIRSWAPASSVLRGGT